MRKEDEVGMTDREKVIKGLEETEIMLAHAVDRGGEMAVMGAFKCLNRVEDALDMLKEQEPVKPRYEDFSGYRIARCGNCNRHIVKHRFCPECGKEVKWDD